MSAADIISIYAIAAIWAMMLLNVALSIGGYISTTGEEVVTQPASALFMIRFDFALIPAILLVVIAVCALAFAKLEPKAEAFENEKKAKLAAQAEAAAE